MTEWTETTFGALGEIFDGPHATPVRRDVGPYFLNISGLDEGRLDLTAMDHVSRDDFQKWTRRVTPRPGDLLFSYETRLGQAALMPDGVEACLGRRMALMRPDPATVDPRFLLYLYLAPAFQATIEQHTIHGATVNRIPLTTMGDWVVSIPELCEQRAIAEVLSAFDDKIAANAKLVETSLDLVNSEFMRRFGGRELALPMGGLADVVDCLHSKKPERLADGLNLMQLANIRDNGMVDRGSTYPISEQDYQNWSRKFETQPWDLVITNVGRIGAVARIPRGYVAALGRNMTGVRPRDARESGAFIAAALLSAPVRREIDQRTDAGSVMNALNVRSIPLLRLPDSTPFERAAFHEWASPIYEYADSAVVSTASLDAVRDALLPALMSGRLRVRDAERLADDPGAVVEQVEAGERLF